ncbi:MAG TPA: hypothetical protein VKV41_25395 [Methylomirabilota bacterium]|nr:hypothetical protein [Methylomirabilota bacterium]
MTGTQIFLWIAIVANLAAVGVSLWHIRQLKKARAMAQENLEMAARLNGKAQAFMAQMMEDAEGPRLPLQ